MVNDIAAHEDWATTLLAAAGVPDIKEKLLTGYQAGDMTYKVHLDGYNLMPYLKGETQAARVASFSIGRTTASSLPCVTTGGRPCSWSSPLTAFLFGRRHSSNCAFPSCSTSTPIRSSEPRWNRSTIRIGGSTASFCSLLPKPLSGSG